jgi:hypothetical protein
MGLFVEDVNLLRTAAYSFTREMGLISGVSRPLELEEVERALRTRAQNARSALAEVAAELQLRWSFQTVRGTGVAPLLALSNGPSVAVMAPRTAAAHARAQMLRRPSKGSTVGAQPIAAIYDGSEPSLVSIRVAALLARSRAVPVALMLCGDSQALPELRNGFRQQWSDDVEVRYIPVKGDSPAGVASAVRNARATLLIASGPPVGVSERDAVDLLLRLDCPLALLMIPAVTRASSK